VTQDRNKPRTSGRALLLMDYQIAVCSAGGEIGARSGASNHTAERGVLGRVATALQRSRQTNDLIVHVRVGFDDEGIRRTNRSAAFDAFEAGGALALSAQGARFCPEAEPVAGELVVTKSCVSPFIGTGLDDLLRAHGVSTVAMGGVATNFVVESAARHAGDSGYRVQVVEDLCASHSEDLHRFAVERILPVFGEVVRLDDIYLPDKSNA